MVGVDLCLKANIKTYWRQKTEKSSYHCLCKKDDCDIKFEGNVGSAKSLKLTIDAIVSC